MRLFRHGACGAERPGALDALGRYLKAGDRVTADGGILGRQDITIADAH